MGKGDNYRPVDKKKYDEEWDRIFGDKKKERKVGWDANGSPVDYKDDDDDKTAIKSNN
tara:strand:+ start:163 stop:336 length:174 start_codon:yes stop_codon:yes gene_type:complete